MTAGYSGTPLARKLGIREGSRVYLFEAPGHFMKLLAPVPRGVKFVPRLDRETDVVHIFTTVKATLFREIREALGAVRSDAAVWVSWPKKASKVPTDITEDVIREVALPLGLVDVKVCAVDETWSGLKLVVRKENRR